MRSLWILMLACGTHAGAATYYVDAAGGNNDHSGLSDRNAWQNLWKVTNASLAPGDVILLKRGSQWNEPLRISSDSVRVDAYGTGAAPVITGKGLSLSANQPGLIVLTGSFVQFRNLQVKNSSAAGILADSAQQISIQNVEVSGSALDGISVQEVTGFTLRDSRLHDNRFSGIATWNSSNVVIRTTESYSNSLSLAESHAGITVDGNQPLSSIVIENCVIHDNLGGSDISAWNAANGITLGSSEPSALVLTQVFITGNEILSNGNPSQNQMGRGISGTFNGEVTIAKNHIANNASAGAYIGDHQSVNLVYEHNTFRNNALRQLGGITNATAIANENTLIIDRADITGMGIEMAGNGSWTVTNNTFLYLSTSTDSFRGYLNKTPSLQLRSDYNFFYTIPGGIQRWIIDETVAYTTLGEWQRAGFDSHSRNPVEGPPVTFRSR